MRELILSEARNLTGKPVSLQPGIERELGISVKPALRVGVRPWQEKQVISVTDWNASECYKKNGCEGNG